MLLTISYRYFPWGWGGGEIAKVIPSTSNPIGIDLDFAWQQAGAQRYLVGLKLGLNNVVLNNVLDNVLDNIYV